MDKVTVQIDQQIYQAAAGAIGEGNVETWLEQLAEEKLRNQQAELKPSLYAGYAAMAADAEREEEASEWIESTFQDLADESR